MAVYTWEVDTENPVQIDTKGLITSTLEALADGVSLKPKRVYTASVSKDFGTEVEIIAELKRLLKIKIKPYVIQREAKENAANFITNAEFVDFETFLKAEDIKDG